MKPIVALAMGDPAGISPELTAKLIALDDVAAKARLAVIGDRRVLDEGAKVAGVRLDLKNLPPDADLSGENGPVFIDLGHLDPSSVKPSTPAVEGGRFALANYRHALTLARDGRTAAVCFTPLNKNAMRLAHPAYDDEISFSADVVGLEGPASEFNVLMGFDRGVTLLGGFPFPICTPAHGTAFEIAGKGIAGIGAVRAGVLLAAEMAQGQKAA
jgi:4-hydroxythreonine-4-phosphate dehydrogenase